MDILKVIVMIIKYRNQLEMSSSCDLCRATTLDKLIEHFKQFVDTK